MQRIIYSTFFTALLIACIPVYNTVAQIAHQSLPSQSPYARLLETQKDYEAAMKKGDSLEVAEMCYRMGKRYVGFQNYTKAQQWFLRALRIKEPLGLSEDVGKIYSQLCGCIRSSQNSPVNLQYDYLAYINFKAANSLRSQIEAYRILGNLHLMTWRFNQPLPYSNARGSLDSAIYYTEKSLQVAKILNHPIDVGTAYEFLGNLWKFKNNEKKSKLYQKKALNIYLKEKLVNNVIKVFIDTGLDLLEQDRPGLAKKWLDRAYLLADSAKTILPDQWLAEPYMLYYEKIGHWKQAFLYQKKSRQMKDREFSIQNNDAVQSLNLLHEHEKKQADFRMQQKEMARQNKLTVVMAFLFLCAGTVGILFYRLFQKYKKISALNAELVKEQEHRTKNNLQSVSNLLSLQLNQLTDPIAVKAMEESVMRIDAMLLLHRELYRGDKLIEVNLKKYIPDLIKSVLRSYDLDKTKVVYELEEYWLHTDKAIPLGLIINELITNSCKYALQNNPNPKLIISCFYKADRIFLRVVDNGPGFVSSSDGNTFGLRLISILMRKLKAKGDYYNAEGCCFELVFDSKAVEVNKDNRTKKFQPV